VAPLGEVVRVADVDVPGPPQCRQAQTDPRDDQPRMAEGGNDHACYPRSPPFGNLAVGTPRGTPGGRTRHHTVTRVWMDENFGIDPGASLDWLIVCARTVLAAGQFSPSVWHEVVMGKAYDGIDQALQDFIGRQH